MPLVDYHSTGRPIIDIDLDEEPYDRWYEVGQIHGRQLARFLNDIQSMCERHAGELLGTGAWGWFPSSLSETILSALIYGSGSIAGKVGLSLGRLFGEEYVDEIRGLAAGSGLCEGSLFLANLTYDISVGFGALPTACSSFSMPLRGAPVLVRNMDWSLPKSTGRHTVVTRFHKGSQSYMNVGPLGCVGVLSAMREGAWAVTLNQAPPNGAPNFFTWPSMHHLRACCDAALTFNSLVRRIKQGETMTPFFAHVVGNSPEEQVIVEHIANDYLLRRPVPGEPLIQTNHFVSEENSDLNCGVMDDAGDTETTDEHYCERYAALERRLSKKPRTIRDAFKKISRAPVTYEATMNSMLLRPSSGESIIQVRT